MAGMNGREIYDNFRDGVGPDGLIAGALLMKHVVEGYGARSARIRALVTRMEAAWQGDAAAAAQRGAGPLETEHDVSGLALDTAQDLTHRQAGSFSEARSRVVPVPPEPVMSNPLAVFTDPTAALDFERQVDEHNAAAQHNVDVMNGYAGASEYNTTNLPVSYGSLANDNAGVGIVPAADGEDAGRRRDVDGETDGERRTPTDDSDPPAPQPGGGSGAVSAAGSTVPGTFVPGTDRQVAPITDPDVRHAANAPSPGGPGMVAAPGPGAGRGTAGAPQNGRATPRGAGPAGPGSRSGVAPPGVPGRPTAAGNGLGTGLGTGRTGASTLPLGTQGRGRDDEESIRGRPAYLEGGDPDDLFDSDEVTAPPTIGAEDD
jgi:hypothetical protein